MCVQTVFIYLYYNMLLNKRRRLSLFNVDFLFVNKRPKCVK